MNTNVEDDLEYYITFPTPTPRETSQGGDKDRVEDDFVFINGDGGDREPVVFLLGWAGAKDTHLAKYAALYNSKGCITIRYTYPISYVFYRVEHKFKPVAKKLLSLLTEMAFTQHPVFFHIFSNGGAVLYHYINQEMISKGAPKINLKGCIFDSCPAPRKISSGIQAMYEVVPGPFYIKVVASFGVFLYLFGWMLVRVILGILTGRMPIMPPWSLVQDSSRVPQLFLYSKADHLVSSDDIDFFAQERQNMGVPVLCKCWLDTYHVQHYRKYPEEYSNTVFSFLTMCLTQNFDVSQDEEKGEVEEYEEEETSGKRKTD
ncbi:transmembrane protein 53 [Oratosquilla oratoria]|uniref:transmembrane protein 53 n=1 Tax=Oratosquilla oratoria TaxID=337810 RepID=UPI003F75777D